MNMLSLSQGGPMPTASRSVREDVKQYSALTQDESNAGSISRTPQKPEDLENATIEKDGSLVVWNGQGAPVCILNGDKDAVTALLLTGILDQRHVEALADAIDSREAGTSGALIELYGNLLLYQPPSGFDTIRARWDAMSNAMETAKNPSNLSRRSPNNAEASLLWTVNRDLVITSAVGDYADRLFEDLRKVAGHYDRDYFTVYDLVGTSDHSNPVVAAHLKALSGIKAEYETELHEGGQWTCHLEPVRRGDNIVGVVGYGVDNLAKDRVPIPEFEEAYCVVTPDGTLVQYSRPFKRMFKIDPTITLVGRPLLRNTFISQVADPADFVRRTDELLRNGTPASDLIEMADGRMIHRVVHPVPHMDGSLRTCAMYWTKVDPNNKATVGA